MIEKMKVEDLDEVLEIENESFLGAYKREHYEYELLDNPCANLYVLRRNGKLIGFIDYWITFESCQLTKIAIKKSERGKGYSHTLMNFMVDKSIEAGCEAIFLEVRESNTVAQSLYEEYDFLQMNIRKGYYSDNDEDAIVMGKVIGGLEMEETYILGIESSCDETACSIVKNGKEIISNVVATQIDVHKKYGGVFPEVASRIHVENVSMVIDEALEKAGMSVEDVDAIAFTQGPGLIGSLHVGVQAAKTLAWAYDKPLVPVHHITGHIFANNLVADLEFPLLALVVSGGHSELVHMEDDHTFKIIGTTQDDAIGEAYDKVARVLGLPYPGGPQIDRLSKEGKPIYKLPTPKTEGKYDFSFSGLKSGVLQFIDRMKRKNEEYDPACLAASFQETALNTIVDKTRKALDDLDVNQIVLAGGVAANSCLREKMQELMKDRDEELLIPPLWCCTDNAAMIATAGYFAYQNGVRADFDVSAKSTFKLQ